MRRNAPIATLADVTLGKMLQPSSKSAAESFVPYLRAAHVQGNGRLDLTVDQKEMWASAHDQESLDLRAGDVLVVEGGAVGRSVVLESHMPGVIFQNALIRLRPNTRSDGRYLNYCLQSAVSSGEIDALCSSVSIAHFTAEKVGRFRIPEHDHATQQRIADYLDRETGEIDAMIAKLDQLSDTLRERFSFTPLLFGLSAESPQIPDSGSPLSGIPDHWGRTKFGYDFAESTERNGSNPQGSLLSISEYRGVELNTRSAGQQAAEDVSNYRVVRPNQLAANMMWLNHGGIGVSALTGYISPDYKAFDVSRRFDPRYAHYLFRSARYRDYFQTIGTGVRPNAQRVTKISLDMMPVPLPPLEEQQRIADHLDEVTGKIDAMLAKTAELKARLLERRSALITDVVTGRKEVA